MTSVTIVLNAIESGEAKTEDLLPLVYEELRQLAAGKMRNERAGLTEEEVAQTLNISRATASRWWTYSKAWLFAKVRAE